MQNDAQQRQEQSRFAIHIDKIKIALGLALATSLTRSFRIINTQVINHYNENDTQSSFMFSTKLQNIVDNNKNLISANLQTHYVTAIDVAKDIDNNFFNQSKTKLKPTNVDLAYASERAGVQTQIITDNLIESYNAIFTKADLAYQKLKTAKSFDELTAMEEYRNLSHKIKLDLKKNFQKAQQDIEVFLQRQSLLRNAQKEIFKEKIVNDTKARVGRISYHEINGAIEKTRFDTGKQQDKREKLWIAKLDDKTRHTHAIIDGQKKGINELFEVRNPANGSIEYLAYPGDMSHGASISNTIHCRCTVVYF